MPNTRRAMLTARAPMWNRRMRPIVASIRPRSRPRSPNRCSGSELHVVEGQLHVARSAQPHHRQVAADADAGRCLVHQEQGDAARAAGPLGARGYHEEVGEGAVADGTRVAVEAPAVAVRRCGGADPGRVGARLRLGHGDGAGALAAHRRHRPAFALQPGRMPAAPRTRCRRRAGSGRRWSVPFPARHGSSPPRRARRRHVPGGS